MFISIIIFIIGIIACLLGFTNLYKKEEYNIEIEEKNKELQKEIENTQKNLDFEKERLKIVQTRVEELRTIQLNYEENAFKSFIVYCEKLDQDYQKKEAEYKELTAKLEGMYDNKQQNLLYELKQISSELKKIKNTRAAAIEAERKEKEVEAHTSDYCPIPTQSELDDIDILNTVKSKLKQPRILCMLIWSTYYQKLITSLCSDRLGIDTVCGIYKITNILNNRCYIGQSVNIADRWKQHAKCGLGIDTPAGNKLYKAMMEDGLHNFAFELIEQCPKNELNEKEKFYIELYQSKEYGYNGTGGNK